MKVILASASPRRRELLELLSIPFEVKVSEVEEDLSETDPVRFTESLSGQKAKAVAKQLTEESNHDEYCVIGADTVVFAKNETGEFEILGKPADRADARRMIGMIQGKAHTVCTGVTVIFEGTEPETITFSEKTLVFVAKMTEEEIDSYLDTDEPYDKAGSYGIQGIFSKFIEKIEGDYFNVVGLPVHRVYQVLRDRLINK